MKVLLPSSKYHKYLYLLLIFHTLVYVVFRLLDKSYQTWDSAGHMALSMRFADMFKEYFGGGSVTLYDIATQSNYYPPLIHLIMAVFNLIFGYHFVLQLGFIFSMFLGTIVLFYKLIINLGYSEKLAFYSTFFYSLSPLVGDQSRVFHLEIPLTLFVLLCYHFLFKSKYFTNSKFTFLFFITFALTQLIKWYGFLFLVVPVLYVLYTGYKHGQIKNMIKPILLGSLMFIVIALPWYILNFQEMRILSSLYAVGEADDPKKLLSIENFGHYIKGLLVYQMYLVPFVCALFGGFHFYKKDRRTALLLFAHLFLVYFLFSLIQNKNQRYLFVLSLPLAILTAYVLDIIKQKKLRIFIVAFTLFIFVFTCFNHIKAHSTESTAWGILLTGPMYEYFEIRPDLYSYRPYKPPMKEIFNNIMADAVFSDTQAVGITPLVDYEKVSAAGLEMLREQMMLDKVYMPVPYYQFEPFKSDYEIVKFLRDKNVSYVLAPENPGPTGLRNYAALMQATEFMKYRSAVWFDKLQVFENEANDITTYKRKDFDVPVKVNTCGVEKTSTGEFKFTIEPLASLILFTGHYNYQSIKQPYLPETLHILEINNYEVYPKEVIINDLPKTGFSYCHRLGTKLKIQKEISSALLDMSIQTDERQSCRDGRCQNLIHTQVNGSDITKLTQTKYTQADFEGTGLQKVMKKLKVIPYYSDEYSLKDELFIEYGGSR